MIRASILSSPPPSSLSRLLHARSLSSAYSGPCFALSLRFLSLQLCSDVRLSEDAYFTSRVHWRSPPPLTPFATYVGLADGVGSWRALGVDPRNFSQRLMTCCTQVWFMCGRGGWGGHNYRSSKKNKRNWGNTFFLQAYHFVLFVVCTGKFKAFLNGNEHE